HAHHELVPIGTGHLGCIQRGKRQLIVLCLLLLRLLLIVVLVGDSLVLHLVDRLEGSVHRLLGFGRFVPGSRLLLLLLRLVHSGSGFHLLFGIFDAGFFGFLLFFHFGLHLLFLLLDDDFTLLP